LARDVFYGRRGRINARELWEQMNTCSCLNLILACIVYSRLYRPINPHNFIARQKWETSDIKPIDAVLPD
jgi:hypothetical protein